MGTCIKIEYLVALANWTLLISHNSLHSIFHVYQWSWFCFLRYSCFSSIFSLNLSFWFCLSSTFLVCLLIFKRFQSFYSFVLFCFFFFQNKYFCKLGLDSLQKHALFIAIMFSFRIPTNICTKCLIKCG